MAVGVCWEPSGGLVFRVWWQDGGFRGGVTPPRIGWILAGGNKRDGGSDALEVLCRPPALGRAALWSRAAADFQRGREAAARIVFRGEMPESAEAAQEGSGEEVVQGIPA
ncbi:hypothetical protein NDU88_011380 [Pleurodeles waltl]|uniref:Uncharacterized protein n=1 Tax=Pleurodeles waltl TaxID=8319 RepID=A0AAV7QYF6_PLEWA|nr:hypothetical protein NDU88_011380 [Pleurodeles waltl]